MGRTFFQDFNRDDEAESEVTVEYTYSGGCEAQTYGPAENCYPAEPAEIEIVKAFDDNGPVTLTDAEEQRFTEWLHENPPEADEPDYDDWRDALPSGADHG